MSTPPGTIGKRQSITRPERTRKPRIMPCHCVLPALPPCRHLASGIGEAELTRLQAHLFVCQPQEAIGAAVNVEEVRRHFRVISMGLDDEPPPAA